MSKRNKFEDVFRYIDLNPQHPNTCWLWKGALSGKNKDRPYIQVAGRKWLAYRVTYWLVNPKWDILNEREYIRHMCRDALDRAVDNPLCCNPAHLLPGTHEDNMLDMIMRGRHGLTKDALRDILMIAREFPEMTQAQIAKRIEHRHQVKVSRQLVTDVLNRNRHKNMLDLIDAEERKLMEGPKLLDD